MKVLNNYDNIWMMLADIRNYTRENNKEVSLLQNPRNLQINWCDGKLEKLWTINIKQLKELYHTAPFKSLLQSLNNSDITQNLNIITKFLNNQIKIP